MKNSYVFRVLILFTLLVTLPATVFAESDKRARDYGIKIGILEPGKNNAITDVKGVKVGQVTLSSGDNIRTGVTAILPYDGNIYQSKVPAAIYIGNGFGKLAGYSQVKELGNIETPIVLTNTLSVAAGLQGIIDYTFSFKDNVKVTSVNGVVGETNDSGLNDIRGQHVKRTDVLKAITTAKTGAVDEGNVGAGTGTKAFNFKGGIGTASRVLPDSLGGYTVGVLVQTNFGGVLSVDGVEVGEELGGYLFQESIESADGSIMIVVATNAPLDSRNLERVAKRAMLGLAKAGGIASNGSGDYVIAFSTDPKLRVPHNADKLDLEKKELVRNDDMSAIFLATIEATEEAIINSLFAAETTKGINGKVLKELPVDKVVELLKKHNKITK